MSHKRPSDNHFCDFRFRFHEAPYVEARPASRLHEPRRPGCVTCRRLRPGRTLRAPARFRVRVGFVLGRGRGRGQGRGRGRGRGLGQGRGRGLALLEDPSIASHTTDLPTYSPPPLLPTDLLLSYLRPYYFLLTCLLASSRATSSRTNDRLSCLGLGLGLGLGLELGLGLGLGLGFGLGFG